ncbi:MAG: hypothetical protein WCW40_11170, partial [Bacteroidota bacterium]
MRKPIMLFVVILLCHSSALFGQAERFYLDQLFNLSWYDWAFNLEGADINRDGHIDMVLGNANETRVFYGGPGILDTAADVKYKGRCLAVCDYNGDVQKDLITMEFVSMDSTTGYWTVNLLFYYGSDTTQIAIDTVVDYTIPFPKLTDYDYSLISTDGKYGNLNGDGKYDLVINSPNYRNPDNGLNTGQMYIYMGAEVPPDTPSYHLGSRLYIPGEQYYTGFGSYFGVGDINGDG